MSNKDVRRKFGANLKKLRNAKDMTQEAVADRAGLHPTYIGQIERGVRNPSLVNITKIAKALGVSTASMMK